MPKRWDRVMREAFEAGYRAGVVAGREQEENDAPVALEPPPDMFGGWYRSWVEAE